MLKFADKIYLLLLAVVFATTCGCAQPECRPGCWQNPHQELKTEKQICQMTEGEAGWVVPWALYADADGKLWLHDGHTVHNYTGGTVQLLIRKTRAGMVVDISSTKERWVRERKVYAASLKVMGHDGCATTDQATLPESRRQLRLEDMKCGDSGWTVPWSMHSNYRGEKMLNGSYTLYDSPGGTVQMKVTRTADGYVVDISKAGYYTWREGPTNYCGDFTALPVKEICK